jgi:hypothetical protein
MSIYRISFSRFWGLIGYDCKKESAEKCDAEAGGQHDVARRKGGFEFGFGFVGHGFGVRWVKEKNVRWRGAPLGWLNAVISRMWAARTNPPAAVKFLLLPFLPLKNSPFLGFAFS